MPHPHPSSPFQDHRIQEPSLSLKISCSFLRSDGLKVSCRRHGFLRCFTWRVTNHDKYRFASFWTTHCCCLCCGRDQNLHAVQSVATCRTPRVGQHACGATPDLAPCARDVTPSVNSWVQFMGTDSTQVVNVCDQSLGVVRYISKMIAMLD